MLRVLAECSPGGYHYSRSSIFFTKLIRRNAPIGKLTANLWLWMNFKKQRACCRAQLWPTFGVYVKFISLDSIGCHTDPWCASCTSFVMSVQSWMTIKKTEISAQHTYNWGGHQTTTRGAFFHWRSRQKSRKAHYSSRSFWGTILTGTAWMDI